MNRVKGYLTRIYKWYGLNMQRIIFVVGLHFILAYLINLPYVNIFTSLFSSLLYLFDWIAILILFKPKKEKVLIAGMSLFAIDFIFAVFRLQNALEFLGEASYFMIGTYIVMSLREIRK